MSDRLDKLKIEAVVNKLLFENNAIGKRDGKRDVLGPLKKSKEQ